VSDADLWNAAPDVVVLDVNETLTDTTPLADAFARVGASGSIASRWFSTVLQLGFGMSMAGTPHRFVDIGVAVLPRLLHGESLTMPLDEAVDAVYGRFDELGLHPDVPEGLRALVASGVRVATLSNGSVSYTRHMLDKYDVADTVEQVLSVEDAPAWKPDPRAYEYALSRLGVPAARTVMVAVHPWDLHGAHQVGMRTAYLDRSGAPYPPLGSQPDVAADSLTELAALFS